MKKFKTLTALLLAGTIPFGLCACENSNSTKLNGNDKLKEQVAMDRQDNNRDSSDGWGGPDGPPPDGQGGPNGGQFDGQGCPHGALPSGNGAPKGALASGKGTQNSTTTQGNGAPKGTLSDEQSVQNSTTSEGTENQNDVPSNGNNVN